MTINGLNLFRKTTRRLFLALSALGLSIAAATWLAGHLAERKLASDLELSGIRERLSAGFTGWRTSKNLLTF